MQKATWIKTDGTTVSVTSSGEKFSLEELQKMVGGSIELVSTRSPVRDMYVNEEGLIRNLPYNSKATNVVNSKWNVAAGGISGDAVIILHKNDPDRILP